MDIDDAIKDVARIAASGGRETDFIQARSIHAFGQVIMWWGKEYKIARESGEFGEHMSEAARALVHNCAHIIHTTTIGMDDAVRRSLVRRLMYNLEEMSGRECLPTRVEADALHMAHKARVN